MTINSVTNTSPGARVLNAKIGENADKSPVVQMVHLASGETKDMEVLNADDPVFKGLVESGEIVVGPKGTVPPTPAEKQDRDAADAAVREAAAKQAGYDEGYAKGVEDTKPKK